MIACRFVANGDKITRIHLSLGEGVAIQGPASQEVVERIYRWVAEYQAGQEPQTQLPLDWAGTKPFQRKVLEALSKVSFGEVICYSELAERAGAPRAARAVGTSCKHNPFPLVIPCHRVIRKDGDIGRFNCGEKIKYYLLEFEDLSASRAAIL